MASVSAHDLREELKAYGVAPENVRLFGQQNPEPELQDYLALNTLRHQNKPAPDGVAEYQGRPVLYFVNEQRLSHEAKPGGGRLFPTSDDEPKELPVIFRQLACRGERVYLARIERGKLRIAPVSPGDEQPNWTEFTTGSTEGKCLFSRLAFGMTATEDFTPGDAVFARLFKLLKHVANRIAKNKSLRPDAISLVGRALFFRFLRDRGVLEGYSVERIAPKASEWTDCFANAENASSTCKWLDQTFNGDFLPLEDNGCEAFFEKVSGLTNGGIFRHLTAVIRGHDPCGDEYQRLIEWEWTEFDFAHIPIGLLSQVYEAFSWEWTPKEAKSTSQHYTPRNIAVTLVDEVFDNLPNAESCRMLDPASGAGVFLVLAFRRLYRELWRSSGRRPGTTEIRRILDQQLVGLDISESALKLAALSLYLTAIELDPEPKPPDKLRFRNLRGNVLHNVREQGLKDDAAALGSLSSSLGTKFDRQFDIVVSNPPWTSLGRDVGERMGEAYKAIVQRIHGSSNFEPQLPDNNPDLPFLMKAAEWCKPGGRIAMALPARILLKAEPIPTTARKALFELLQVDGIINGTNLSDTSVWPKMRQPWMLLFATNKRPSPQHSTYFVTLPLDVSLNRTGTFRIDSVSARPISNALAATRPWLWKTLSIGTMLDVDVVGKMKASCDTHLKKYWKKAVGKRRTGKGYQLAEKQKVLRSSRFLKGLPNLDSTELFRFAVDTSQLNPFTKSRICWPRYSSIYDAPLVLMKQAPGEDRQEGRGLLAFERIAYSESFNGYSAKGHADGELLARYLHIFVHSDIWQYYLLMTSPEFGAERRRARKSDLDRCPFVPFESLTDDDRKEVARLSRSLVGSRDKPWQEIDAFFARLYGLRSYDLQVIRDTLAVGMPYESARSRACELPTATEKNAFLSALKKPIAPLLSNGQKLLVERWKPPAPRGQVYSPFDLVMLTADPASLTKLQTKLDGVLDKIIAAANETGTTQIVISERMGLIVGIYNQFRYWTLSRARLLASDIIRLHLDSITG